MKPWNIVNSITLLNIWILASCGRGGNTKNGFKKRSITESFSQQRVTVPSIRCHGKHVNSTLLKGKHHNDITVTFTAFDKDFVVDLTKNKHLLPSRYIERHFDDHGKEIITSNINHDSRHCYYHGNVRGEKNNHAALSTCDGIRGYVSDGSESYYIEPVEDDRQTYEHWVMRHSDHIPHSLTCGHDDRDQSSRVYRQNLNRVKRMKRRTRMLYDSNDDTMILELYMVNDRQQYLDRSRNLERVIQRTTNIVNIVSSLFRPLNIYIALVGVEVWTDADKITIMNDAEQTMNNFLEYRRTYISPNHPNDNAQLIIGRHLGNGVVGKAPIMTICTWKYSGGVSMDQYEVTGPTATTVAHEIGHNFGLNHDLDECTCPQPSCIMSASSGGLDSPTRWSSCSIEQFDETFLQGMDYCLHNLPETIYSPVCGNGFLDEGEQCDCGLEKDCTSVCCNATTCMLTANATCATGKCCDLNTCQMKPASTPCREASGPCDLPEYCIGSSEFCPDDIHIEDTTTCEDDHGGQSYCYKGRCQTHDAQCRKLWGDTGERSHELCFKHFNTYGTLNGNCGFDWLYQNFSRCKREDVMCGLLHCTHRNEKLMFWREALSYTMPEAWVSVAGMRKDCKGAILDVGLDMPDPGMTPDGARCGEEKMCVDQKCVALADVNTATCPDCNGNGVCNSVGQCHCHAGFAPPLCDKPGTGGSTDGGPMLPPVIDDASATTTEPGSGDTEWTSGTGSSKSLVVGLCVFFLVILPLLCLLVFLIYRHRRSLKSMWESVVLSQYREKEKKEAGVTTIEENPAIDEKTSVSTSKPRHEPIKPPVPPPPSAKPKERPTSIVRHPSFKPEDISSPKLQSSTNTNLKELPRVAYKPANSDISSPGVAISPTRPAPYAPQTTDITAEAKPLPPRPIPPRSIQQESKPSRPPMPLPVTRPNTDASMPDTIPQTQQRYQNAAELRAQDNPVSESRYYNAAPARGIYINSKIDDAGKKPVPTPKRPGATTSQEPKTSRDGTGTAQPHSVSSLRNKFMTDNSDSKPKPNARPSQLPLSRPAHTRFGQSGVNSRPGQSVSSYRPGQSNC